MITDDVLGIQKLDDENFEHDTQASTGSTTGDWFVVFYENFKCRNTLSPEVATSMAILKQQRKEHIIFGEITTDDASKSTVERFGISHENSCWSAIYIQKGTVYYMKYPGSHTVHAQDFVRYLDGRFRTDSRIMTDVPKPQANSESSHNLAMYGILSLFAVLAVVLKLVVAKEKTN